MRPTVWSMSGSEEISMSISSIHLSISFQHLHDYQYESVRVLAGGERLVDSWSVRNRTTSGFSGAGRVPLVDINIHSDCLH